MSFEDIRNELRAFWLPKIGAGPAELLTGLARPSFGFTATTEPNATGQCRFGGPALLEPGTAWPHYKDRPLSLFAIVDTDALAEFCAPEVPEDTGLLNFFILDCDSELLPEPFWDGRYPDAVAVIPARTELAVPVEPIPLATPFMSEPWQVTAELLLPFTYSFSHVYNLVKRDPGDEYPDFDLLDDIEEIMRFDEEWQGNPCLSGGGDRAFGWPDYPTGNTPLMPDDDYSHPLRYRQLLQLTGNDQWRIGGDGGWFHVMIPDAALKAGDFSQAFSAPGHW